MSLWLFNKLRPHGISIDLGSVRPGITNGLKIGDTVLTNDELLLALLAGDSSGTVTGITAGTTQTQAGATQLTGRINFVTTVGTAGDGVALPAAEAGLTVVLYNIAASNTMKVWPKNGASDAINALAANLSIDMPAKSVMVFRSVDGTTWYTDAQSGIYLPAPTTQTGGMLLRAVANAANYLLTITNASMAADRTYTIPDGRADCTFMLFKEVTDAGPMTATGGFKGQIARNTSNSKTYICSVAHATAATWELLN